MSAHSAAFPWPSYYGHFDFFEQRMKAHNGVRNFESLGNGRYRIINKYDQILEVFVCECYSFGGAEYLEVTSKIEHLDVVIISSNWCGYTPEVKMQCRSEHVGLFNIRDFMAALNKTDFWNYLDKWEEKRLKERGLL